MPGYTLDTENGKRNPVDDNDPSKGYTVTPIDPSKPTTVTYTPETGKSVQVAYVDENGVEIAGYPVKILSGQTDQTIDYGTKAIAGYVLTADGTLDKTKFAATDDGTLLTISYEKKSS
ncbi:MucBP domain-containing protein [Lacticaseibacillus manihotivorans]|uniref:MucBP domain-containing protein n=1 Tax=Lacticaseibacillus manihotivorans TaxID=88233 RepID=UPI0006D006A1|nr:MucBP domain-containing protein [Lacticaseibacillus manihotivorans]